MSNVRKVQLHQRWKGRYTIKHFHFKVYHFQDVARNDYHRSSTNNIDWTGPTQFTMAYYVIGEAFTRTQSIPVPLEANGSDITQFPLHFKSSKKSLSHTSSWPHCYSHFVGLRLPLHGLLSSVVSINAMFYSSSIREDFFKSRHFVYSMLPTVWLKISEIQRNAPVY